MPACRFDLAVYISGEDAVPAATMDFDWFKDLTALPKGRESTSARVFGPRGELIDALRGRT